MSIIQRKKRTDSRHINPILKSSQILGLFPQLIPCLGFHGTIAIHSSSASAVAKAFEIDSRLAYSTLSPHSRTSSTISRAKSPPTRGSTLATSASPTATKRLLLLVLLLVLLSSCRFVLGEDEEKEQDAASEWLDLDMNYIFYGLFFSMISLYGLSLYVKMCNSLIFI